MSGVLCPLKYIEALVMLLLMFVDIYTNEYLYSYGGQIDDIRTFATSTFIDEQVFQYFTTSNMLSS